MFIKVSEQRKTRKAEMCRKEDSRLQRDFVLQDRNVGGGGGG